MVDFKRSVRRLIGPLFGGLLVAYFVYHSIQGGNGILAWQQLDRQIAAAEITLAELSTERNALEHRVNLLNPGQIDPDMFEEQGRRLLNFSHPDEIIIQLPVD